MCMRGRAKKIEKSESKHMPSLWEWPHNPENDARSPKS